jgi:hypothetical protein
MIDWLADPEVKFILLAIFVLMHMITTALQIKLLQRAVAECKRKGN